MNYRFYHDTMKSYLIIACALGKGQQNSMQEEEEGSASVQEKRDDGRTCAGAAGRIGVGSYQYQMIAANHIEGLLPCSLRSMNGEDYLYLDITSLQSIGSLFRSRRMNNAMVRRILYSLVETGESIARYLLDSRSLLTDPRFIFYRHETDTCLYVYDPGERAADYSALFQFISDRIDPAEKWAAGVIYQLCDLAENENFVLNRDVLDQLYENTDSAEQNTASIRNGQRALHEYASFEPWEKEPAYGTVGVGRTDSGETGSSPGMGREAVHPERHADRNRRQNPPPREPQHYERKEQPEGGFASQIAAEETPAAENLQKQAIQERLTRTLMGAILLLAIAVGAEAIHLHFDLLTGYDMAARGIAAAGAGGCILLTCYGVTLVWKKRQLAEVSEEQGPPMEPTLDFRRSQLCGGIKTGCTGSESGQGQAGAQAPDGRADRTWAERAQRSGVRREAYAGTVAEGRMRTVAGGRNVVSYSLNDWDLP